MILVLVLIVVGIGFNVFALVIDRYSLKRNSYGEINLKKRYLCLAIAAFFVSLGFSCIITGFTYLN